MGRYYIGGMAFDDNALAHHGVKGMQWYKHIFGPDANRKYVKWMKDTTSNVGNFFTGNRSKQRIADTQKKADAAAWKAQLAASRNKRVRSDETAAAEAKARMKSDQANNQLSRLKSNYSKTLPGMIDNARNSNAAKSIRNFVTGGNTGENLNRANNRLNTAENNLGPGNFLDPLRTANNQMEYDQALRQQQRAQEARNSTLPGIGENIAKTATNAYNDASRWASNAANDIRDTATNAYNDASKWASNAANDIRDTATNAYNDASKWASNAANDIRDTATNAYNDASKWVNDRANDIANSPAGKWTANAYNDASKWVGDRANDIANSPVGQWTSNAYNDASKWASNAANDVGNWTTNAYNDVGQWVGDRSNDIRNAYNTASDWVGQRVDNVGDFVGNTYNNARNAVNGAFASDQVKNNLARSNDRLSEAENDFANGRYAFLDPVRNANNQMEYDQALNQQQRAQDAFDRAPLDYAVNTVNNITRGVSNAYGTARDTVSDLYGKVSNDISKGMDSAAAYAKAAREAARNGASATAQYFENLANNAKQTANKVLGVGNKIQSTPESFDQSPAYGSGNQNRDYNYEIMDIDEQRRNQMRHGSLYTGRVLMHSKTQKKGTIITKDITRW